MPARDVVVVGGGINGMVASFYLRRAGFEVTLVERQPRPGGACVSAEITIEGHRYFYPLGATVLGLMQDFIFEETGLSERLSVWAPTQEKLVYFHDEPTPIRIHRDPDRLAEELRQKCGETGRLSAFREDEARVVAFLQQGYRSATPPVLDQSFQQLGTSLTDRWIRGSAYDLLNHYFDSDRAKVYMAMTVVESGPVSLHEPFSAFNIPLLDSGSIFGSYYGFVKGGIWRITEELAEILRGMGVRLLCSTEVTQVDKDRRAITWRAGEKTEEQRFDELLFATDPLTAERLSGEASAAMKRTRFSGTSGKLTLVFREPVRWRNEPQSQYDTSFRFLFSNETLDELESASQSVLADAEFTPGYIQIYCDGAAMRVLGHDEPFDRIIAFFKNLRFGKRGEELSEVKAFIERKVLAHIENPDALLWSRFSSPMDLKDQFFFPEGNVDHTMMAEGQNFADRHFSSTPDEGFYQFGSNPHIHYCGSGAYPCGSVTGTAGYMCAQQLIGRERA